MAPTNRTAILIFTRDIREEIHEKNLFGQDRQKNIRLFEALNRKIKRTVLATELPFYEVSSKNQVGKRFLDRYRNSIQSVFDKGYSNVIVVGNDSPELSSENLSIIAQKLEDHDLLYGRTKQGGIFTLGISRKGFEALDMERVPWQTSRVAAYFDHLELDTLKVEALLPVLSELNTSNDYRQFLTEIRFRTHLKRIYWLLFGLVFDQKVPVIKSIIQGTSLFNPVFSLRGPPAMFEH